MFYGLQKLLHFFNKIVFYKFFQKKCYAKGMLENSQTAGRCFNKIKNALTFLLINQQGKKLYI